MRKICVIFTLLLMAALFGATFTQAQTGLVKYRELGYVPLSQIQNREILVEFKKDKSASAVRSFFANKGVSSQRKLSLSYTTFEIVRVPEGQNYHSVLVDLMNDPQVASAGPNVIKQVSEFVPNDPLFLGGASDTTEGLENPFVKNNQYALMLTRAQEAWDITAGSPNVIVAILDTGAKLDHEDLEHRLWVNTEEQSGTAGTDDDENGFVDDVFGWDFQGWDESSHSGGDSDNTDPSESDRSHGTSTASIIAAEANNGVGLAGVAGGKSQSDGARLMVLRVGTDQSISVEAEIGAIDYAIQNGAHIISMSFGGASGGPPEEAAIDRAWDAGLLIVAAAGNIGQGNVDGQGNPLVDLPAGFENCIAVGATTIFDAQRVTGTTAVIEETLASYSKTGPEIDICAPGTHIMSCANVDGEYTDTVTRQFTGTSAATPVVAGLAALIWSAPENSSATNTDVRQLIETLALDLGPDGLDSSYGHGRIDMFASVSGDAAPTKLGDTNGDGTVDASDVQPIIDRFGARVGDANYSEDVDTNGDGVIDELDLFAVGRQFED
jgi:subtilisin family serine protease